LRVGLAIGVVAGVVAWSLISDGKTLWTVVAGVLATVLATFAPTWLDSTRNRERGAHRQLPGNLVSELPQSVAWLLHPAKEVIGFFGRGWILAQLETWCTDRDAAVVRLVTAPGGYGKTRLARELSTRLSGWKTWWVAAGRETKAAADLTDGRLLLVVDYADARDPAALAELLVTAASRTKVRVLLLARSDGPWWTSLSASYPPQAALLDGMTVKGNVIPLPARADDRPPAEIVTAAIGEFADHLRYAMPVDFVPRQHDPDTPLLRLHAEALLAVLGGPRSTDDRYDVLAEVLAHEARYWHGCARRAGLPLPTNLRQADSLLRQLIGIAALLGIRDHTEAEGIIRRAPLHETIDPSDWADWLTDLYPALDGKPGTLQPDLLAEHLALDVLKTCTEPQRSLIFSDLTVDQAAHALTMLGRATQDHADTAALIDTALTTDPETMTHAVIRVARQFPGTFAPRLTQLLAIADLGLDRLRDLTRKVPYPSRELCPVALALTTRIVNQDTDSPTATKARWRNWHAIRLAESGRRTEALTTSEEAVTLYRELVAGNRDAYLPNLATSLWTTPWVCLKVGGPMDLAVAAGEEAVALFEELAGENSAAFGGQLRGAARTLAEVYEARGEGEAAAGVRERFGV
jgi:hypothetical protein